MTPLIIAVKQEHLSPLPPSIVAAHLDNPVSGKITQKEETRISGWVLPRNTNDKISIRIATPFGSYNTGLQVKRPDVILNYANRIDYTDFVCGFDFHVPFFLDSEIFIRVGNQEYSWAQASVPAPPEIEDGDFGELLAFLGSQRSRAAEKPLFLAIIDALKGLDDAEFRRRFLSAVSAINGPDAILASAQSPAERAAIRAFFNEWNALDFTFHMLDGALSNGQISLKNPLNSLPAHCDTSYNLTTNNLQNINFLFFSCDEDPFVVIQHVTMLDAIYFPNTNKLYTLGHFSAGLFEECILTVRKNLKDIVKNDPAAPGVLGSLVVAANRPFHFYNDTLPALSMIEDRGYLPRVPQILTLDTCSYFPIEKIYGSSKKIKYSNSDSINAENAARGSFSLRLAVNANLLPPNDRKRADDQLLACLPEITTPAVRDRISALTQHFPVLWCGITGQKRSWTQQVEGLASVINGLRAAWPNLAVVLDGWTVPLQPTAGDRVEIERDMEVAHALEAKLPPGTVKVMTIGMTSAEKIAIGQACDLFVANFGSGSIHVARFARAPGVSHINTRFPRTGHVHTHTIEVPEEFVTDLPAPENTSLDAVSYSVSPDVILRLVVQVLESGICLQRRHRRAGLKTGPLVSWNSTLP